MESKGAIPDPPIKPSLQEGPASETCPPKTVCSHHKQPVSETLTLSRQDEMNVAQPPSKESQQGESVRAKGGVKQERKRRTPDAEGRLALTHRHPDFLLPELPSDIYPTPSDFLDEESTRRKCPKCRSNRSLFCYDCLLVLTDRSKVPTVKLPFHVHILLHGEERRSAATSVHAALLAPGQVTIYEGNSFPKRFDPAVSAVLFPSATAVPVSELAMERLENVLLIDSKWKKARTLIEDPLLRGLPHVRLEPVKTAFWRYHTKNVTDDAVSTIEAVYYLCKQRHKKAHDGDASKCHCYDDLLFYFAHIYRRIRSTGD